MDLNIYKETFGQENQTWLDSEEGTDNAMSVTVDITKGFVAGTHYPNGYLPSGTPLGKVTASNKYGLYDDAASDGRQTLVGLLLTGQKVGTGDLVAPLYTGPGRVNSALLPFTVDAAGKTDAAGRIFFI
jgi:Bacteriophage lambda head decoration protein D